MEFAEVAETLGRGEAACRQLAARAREHVRAARPRFPVRPDEGARLAEAFLAAARSGDAATLGRLLAADATLHSDGGGKKRAALNLIHGRDKIVAFFAGLARKRAAMAIRVRPSRINGLPGFVAVEPDGTLQTIALEIAGTEIAAIYVVRNPDKLRHVPA
jgi:RNA polymerase sigma-70 factor (ECF subfamily)